LRTFFGVLAVDSHVPGRRAILYRGANAMDNDTTALERKVLAHEQILQVLIGHLAETEPKFLDRLKAVFTRHHILASNEYAEQFIHEIERMQEYKATR